MKKYVAAVQMDCVTGDMEENTAHIIRMLKEIKEEEPQTVYVVFPEMALWGYENLEQISKERCQKELISYLEEIASVCQSLQLNAVVGAPYFGDLGIENALYLLNDTGKVQHVYSKKHLIAPEKEVFVSGHTYGICQTAIGRIGFLVCWDSAFPEEARAYAKQGIELLSVSAAWESPYERQWELAVCGRSFDNDVPVIASNRIGKSGELMLAGKSMITDCLGNILAQEKENKESYILEDLERVLTKQKRKGFGSQIEELK